MYKATTRSFVSLRGGQTAGELLQGSTFVQNSIQSFVQLAGMPVVLDPVIQQLGLDTTASKLASGKSSAVASISRKSAPGTFWRARASCFSEMLIAEMFSAAKCRVR